MNNEFLKMQKLAGLITEGRYKARLNEIEINKEELMPKFEEIWKDKTLDYSSLIGTDPIYKGLDGVLNNPKIKQNAFDWAYELTIEDEEEDSSMFKAYTSDGIDYEIMQAFAPQLAKNLIKHEVTLITRQDFDLVNKEATDKWFKDKFFDIIIHTAIKGGSRLKSDNSDVFYQNLQMFYNLFYNNHCFNKLIHFG